MRSTHYKLLLLVFIIGCVSNVFSADVSIIVNKQVTDELSNEQIKSIFLGKLKNLPDGSKVIPLGRGEKSDIYSNFNKKILKKSNKQIKAYWSRLVFTGRDVPPKIIDTDADILDLVSKNPSLIGYISSGRADNSVRVVLEI
jgi:ABC-type phosphate transport system substrate-binding protein